MPSWFRLSRAARRVETPRRNEFLAKVTAARPPISKDKRQISFKYITQMGGSPPTFILFTHRPAPLFPSYERYFIQALRERFGFRGSPVRLLIRRS